LPLSGSTRLLENRHSRLFRGGWRTKRGVGGEFSQESATPGHRTFRVLAQTGWPEKRKPERRRLNIDKDDNMTMKRDAPVAAPDGWMPRAPQTIRFGG